MKSQKRKLLEKILRKMAVKILNKYQPTIIGITGSVGKTSTKEAIFTVLSHNFQVWKNEANYNNEVGVPLSILGVKSGESSFLKWALVFLRYFRLKWIPFNYPEILILEVGVDRPGDIDYLTTFLKPHVGVITNISQSHLEFFKSLDHIAREKRKLIEALDKNGFSVLNGDDQRVVKMKNKTKGKVIFYGFLKNTQVRASDEIYNYSGNRVNGLSFKLNYQGKIIPIRLPYILAKHQIYAALASIAVGTIFEINLVKIAKSLKRFYSPKGRMNLISGINKSQIIDDTYNASPVSTAAALEVMASLKAKRKIAVLGDMLELGSASLSDHKKIIKTVFEKKLDYLFVIGKIMKQVLEELEKEDYKASRKIIHFDHPKIAGESLVKLIQRGDLILVKASQGMRLEKVVEKIMASPEEASNLLCRQGEHWKRRAFAP